MASLTIVLSLSRTPTKSHLDATATPICIIVIVAFEVSLLSSALFQALLQPSPTPLLKHQPELSLPSQKRAQEVTPHSKLWVPKSRKACVREEAEESYDYYLPKSPSVTLLDVVSSALPGEDTRLFELAKQAEKSLETTDPELCSEGEGGTYFVRSDEESRVVAVFKPSDEDAQSENNPKRRLSDGGQTTVRASIPKGGCALREFAAFALDRGFCGVPPTAMVRVDNWSHSQGSETGYKVGSLQQFQPHKMAAWDMEPSRFSMEDVHRIGVMDIRMLNTDRHGGNILVVEGPSSATFSLVPIDHGYAFPTTLDEAPFDWLEWPQAKLPFSEQTLKHIESIDVESDAQLLSELGLEESAVKISTLCTRLLKQGAKAGLTLFEIGRLCTREDKGAGGRSPLEKAVLAAQCSSAGTVDGEAVVSALVKYALAHGDCRATLTEEQ